MEIVVGDGGWGMHDLMRDPVCNGIGRGVCGH